MKLDTLIRGGTLVDLVAASLMLSNLGIADGQVAYVGYGAPEAGRNGTYRYTYATTAPAASTASPKSSTWPDASR